MAEIVMPRLSDTMEEGTILRWIAREGEHLSRGQELVEIETDKATMVYESDQDGVLRVLAQEGDTLPVGAPIASVGEDGPQARAAQTEADNEDGPASAGPARGQVVGAPARAVGEWARGVAPADASADGGEQSGERVKASPLARRVARERGVELSGLRGSGPGGRIVKADVESASVGASAQQGAPGGAQAPARATGPGEGARGLGGEVALAKGAVREVELTRTQQTIARRMAESKATIPHFALQVDVDMGACVELREELKRIADADATVPTYNDMVVKACALALRAHPRANSSYRDGRLQLHERVNVGVAVAVESEDAQGGALIVPTVFEADRKALGEIARETRALARSVREGSITPPELSGATFTVSNLGMFGVRAFTAIINPPQAAIMAVGEVREAALAHAGALRAGRVMSLTLACDHRILYGADAARFLAHVREELQKPAALTL